MSHYDRITLQTGDSGNITVSWSQLAELLFDSGTVTQTISTVWLTLRFLQVLFMKIGLLLLETGSMSTLSTCRIKRAINKEISCVGITIISYWLLGYRFAFGSKGSSLIGFGEPKGRDTDIIPNSGLHYSHLLFYLSTTSITNSIAFGSLSERTSATTYIVMTILVSVFISPLLVHWVWSTDGWANHTQGTLLGTGVLDFAGGSVINIAGGTMALVGAYIIGPRTVNMKTAEAQHYYGHDILLTLGVYFIWLGQFSLNMGHVVDIRGPQSAVLGKMMLNTTLCTATSFITVLVVTLVLSFLLKKRVNPEIIIKSAISGVAGSAAGCPLLGTGGTVVTGILSGLLYLALCGLVRWGNVDDVSSVAPLYLGGGIAGMLAVATFTTLQDYKTMVGDKGVNTPCGFLYTCNGLGGKQFGANFIFVLVTIGWAGFSSVCIFKSLKIMGLSRDDSTVE